MSTPPVVRFAPSPTGRIHIGNARTALLNAAVRARPPAARFVLRFDDTDVERSRTEYAEGIEARPCLARGRAGLRVVRQSDRFDLYAAAAEKLKAAGRLYPGLRDGRRARAAAQAPCRGAACRPSTIAPRLALTEAEQAGVCGSGWTQAALALPARRRQGRDPGLDLVRGDSHIDCASLSDPVLVREDGSYLYTLPSVADDIDLGISHVIRGEDHVTNTAVQIQLFRALGGTAPTFGHHNLLMNQEGQGLSKRSGALSLTGLREAGIEALAVAAMAVLTGSSVAVQPVWSLERLQGLVDLAHLSRAPARFDEAELWALSAKTLHGMPFGLAAERLAERGIAGDGAEAFWLAVRGNLERFDQVDDWRAVVAGDIVPVIEDRAALDEAAGLLPPEPWDGATWATWTAAVKAATGRKGRALFHPLRLALTGRETGPELASLLPLIGRQKAKARLSGRSG